MFRSPPTIVETGRNQERSQGETVMEIRCRRKREVTILDLAGRLMVSPGDTELLALRSTIAELIAEGHVWVSLCLTGLASIDARGLGELVFTLMTLRARGGDLMLIAPTGAVRKMLAVTRLDTVFSLSDSELEAMRRLRRGGPSAGGGLLGNDFEIAHAIRGGSGGLIGKLQRRRAEVLRETLHGTGDRHSRGIDRTHAEPVRDFSEAPLHLDPRND